MPSRCHKCGSFLMPFYKYCPECGEKIPPEKPVKEIICPSCHGTGKITSLFQIKE